MVKRPHATLAAIAAILGMVCVLSPWCMVTVGGGAAGEQTYTHNGLECGYRGTEILVFAGIGAALALVVAILPRSSLPLRPRHLLLAAAAPLLAAFCLAFLDYLRETTTCELSGLGTVIRSDHGTGILITLVGTGGGGLCALWGAWTRAARELPDSETVKVEGGEAVER
jgi:hypothetical protein